MWIYHQMNGELLRDKSFEGTGYSGRGDGRNNPDAENKQSIGPIPHGRYIIGPAHTHPHLGPIAMELKPTPDTDTLGRSGFFIHGDNARHDASHGCIILGPAIRRAIAESGDCALEVLR